MTPTELIRALERKKLSLYWDIQTLNDVIACLKNSQHETLKELEARMALGASGGWRSLKKYLVGDEEGVRYEKEAPRSNGNGQKMGKEPTPFRSKSVPAE